MSERQILWAGGDVVSKLNRNYGSLNRAIREATAAERVAAMRRASGGRPVQRPSPIAREHGDKRR